MFHIAKVKNSQDLNVESHVFFGGNFRTLTPTDSISSDAEGTVPRTWG